MATHSNILAWRIPWTDEPGGLQSIGLQRVGHKWVTKHIRGFSSSHVQMWELDHKEGWALKNWCFQMVVLEKTLERPLNCRIKPANPKGNQPWIFIGGLMLKLKLQYFGHLMWRLDSLEKIVMKDWRQKRGGRQHHWLNGLESVETSGDSGGHLICCSPWGGKESDTI